MTWNRKTSRKDRKDRKRKEPRFIGGFLDGISTVRVTRETFERRRRKRMGTPLTMVHLEEIEKTLSRASIGDGVRESLRLIDGVDFASIADWDRFANEIVGGKLTILLDPTDHEKVLDAMTSRGFVFRKISSLTQITGEPS